MCVMSWPLIEWTQQNTTSLIQFSSQQNSNGVESALLLVLSFSFEWISVYTILYSIPCCWRTILLYFSSLFSVLQSQKLREIFSCIAVTWVFQCFLPWKWFFFSVWKTFSFESIRLPNGWDERKMQMCNFHRSWLVSSVRSQGYNKKKIEKKRKRVHKRKVVIRKANKLVIKRDGDKASFVIASSAEEQKI